MNTFTKLITSTSMALLIATPLYASNMAGDDKASLISENSQSQRRSAGDAALIIDQQAPSQSPPMTQDTDPDSNWHPKILAKDLPDLRRFPYDYDPNSYDQRWTAEGYYIHLTRPLNDSFKLAGLGLPSFDKDVFHAFFR